MTIAVLDKEKIAAEPGFITVYNYDAMTGEYSGFNEEYLAVGVGLPACSTDVPPPAANDGFVSVFAENSWEQQADHRGTIVYSTGDRSRTTIDYIGPIQPGFVTEAPATQYDIWSGDRWVTDETARQAAVAAEAVSYKQTLIDTAMLSISLIQLKLQAGRQLTTAETTKLNAVLDYVDAVTATDISTAPDIEWPELPKS